jgi:hypothetical protein
MAFSRGALGPAKTIQTPIEIAWQTTPSNHSAGSPPDIQEAVFFEQRRSDGRILFVLATAIANDAEQSRWLRFLEFALAKNPNLQGLAPADLLRRLHGYRATTEKQKTVIGERKSSCAAPVYLRWRTEG